MGNDMFSVEGLRVLVTGSTRGIGNAIATSFSERGAHVVVTGRSEGVAAEAAAKLPSSATGIGLDVSSETSVLQACDWIAKTLGGIDVIVNNAGIDPHYAALNNTTIADWRNIIETNLSGVFLCCKHMGEFLLQKKGGSIINISSIAGSVGLRRQVPYCASKGGVEQLTRALALDWAEAGIRVNAIGYGFIETDLTSAMTGHAHIAPRLLARTPMGRFGQVTEVAGAAIFLASNAASYVTGHTLMVDGGWTAA